MRQSFFLPVSKKNIMYCVNIPCTLKNEFLVLKTTCNLWCITRCRFYCLKCTSCYQDESIVSRPLRPTPHGENPWCGLYCPDPDSTTCTCCSIFRALLWTTCFVFRVVYRFVANVVKVCLCSFYQDTSVPCNILRLLFWRELSPVLCINWCT
jgi:hypothetical protein